MSKTTDALEEVGIFNPNNMVSKGKPYLYYAVAEGGRSCLSFSRWVLCVKGAKFKDQPWYHNGNLWFMPYGSVTPEAKKKSFDEAMAKVQELFPGIEMVKAPYRETWVPKEDLAAAMAMVKENKKGEKS
jgi:hypothetical protein